MGKTIIDRRVLLKEIEENDIKNIIKYLKEEKIKKFTNISIDHIKKKETFINKNIKRRVIILLETKEIIGSITIKNIRIKHKRADIGYRIGNAFEGKGLMKESLIILLENLFSKENLERIQARIRTDNIPSIKLAERIGFIYEGTARNFKIIDNKYYDFHLYGLIKQDFINLTKDEK